MKTTEKKRKQNNPVNSTEKQTNKKKTLAISRSVPGKQHTKTFICIDLYIYLFIYIYIYNIYFYILSLYLTLGERGLGEESG